MPTTTRHIGQIAAEAGITKDRTLRAIILKKQASKGASVREAGNAAGLADSTVQRYARVFGLNFSDYSPKAIQYKEGGKRQATKRIKLNTGD